MLNHITLMGRLTRDPEVRYTQNGTAAASFTLAVERDFANRDTGERQTDFINISAWRQTAEFVSKYLQKGALVAVSGRLQIKEWTDRDGVKRRTPEVVAANTYFAEGRKHAADSDTDPYNRASDNSYGNSSEFQELNDDDEELPF